MLLFHRAVHRAQFGACLIERCSRSETRKKFRHAMYPLSYHRGREMMRTARDVGDDLGLLRIRDARLEHADDDSGTIALHAAEANSFANNRRIALQRVRPE